MLGGRGGGKGALGRFCEGNKSLFLPSHLNGRHFGFKALNEKHFNYSSIKPRNRHRCC